MCRNSRCGTPAKVSCNANSLVADENTPDVMLWFIKAYDYNQKRVLNVSFCTRYMGPPFFFRAIPTYGVLPYSMISVYAVLYILQSTSLISVIIDSRVEGVPVLLLYYLWCDKKYLKVQNCIDY